MQKHIDEKIAYNDGQILALRQENVRLKVQRAESAGKTGIEKWRGNCFESSSGLTKEFSDFARDYRRELKKAIGDSYIIAAWSRGHFAVSAFVRNIKTGKTAYISTSDVRGGRDGWYNNILIRTAKHEKDYTGGSNGYATWPGLPGAIAGLTA